MDRNDLRSQSLDLLRFPLAIVVMTIHVWFPGVADATADVPALNALSGLVAGLLWDQSVPVYFFISGFVFFLNVDMSAATYRRKLRNRTKSLLIPYIIWNTLAIAKLLLFALPCLGFLFAGICIAFQGVFQALECGLESLLISLGRQVVFILPVAWCITRFITGAENVSLVWWTFLIGEGLTLLCALFMYARVIRKKLSGLEVKA